MGRGISSGTMGIVVLAVLAGLVGAYVVRNSLLTEPVPVKAAPARTTVPLAAADLPAGRTITMGDIVLTSMTAEEMTASGFDLMKTMLTPEQIIRRTSSVAIKQGQPFLTSDFYLEGGRRNFTTDLRPGFRAFSMPLAKDRGGALSAKTMVDVFFRSTEKPSSSGRTAIPEVTLQLLQGIEIIDVYEPPPPAAPTSTGLDIRDLNTTRNPPPPTVTLAVTPEQAQILQTATGRGELTLVARPENERLASATPLRGKTLDDLLGIEPPPQIVVFTTEAYRRGSRSLNVYRNDRLAEELSTSPPPLAPTPNRPGDEPAIEKPTPMSPFPPEPNKGDAPLPPAPPAPAPAPGAAAPVPNVPQ